MKINANLHYGFIVPVYNHGYSLESVVSSLALYELPIIVIDDGNDEENKKIIKKTAKKYSQVVLVTRKKNGGKGKALKCGIIKAFQIGLTHVFQIDSDGQHDTSRIDFFLNESKKNPDAVICGYPEYEANAPFHRVNGRKIANFWIHFVTLSKEIIDGMIGFRIYPVAPYYKLIKGKIFIDSRMGCDIDVLVRLSWMNVPIISRPVKISYPAGGISNFRMIRDNLHISWTYARLVIGMLLRLPALILRKCLKRSK